MSQLARKIAAEIQNHGSIPFTRFMELALYCPVYGYYEKEGDTVGHRGDYYTSVSVGNLFGQLLAFQFSAWLGSMPKGLRSEGPYQLVEAGAHRGELARDILTWLRERRPDLLPNLEYWIVEPSARRRQWQKEHLAPVAGNVQWASGFTELAQRLDSGVCGIIFSNELLDAFPVCRFAWDAPRRAWAEWAVGLRGDRFVWEKISDSQSTAHSPQAAGLGPELVLPKGEDATALWEVLPDGFTIETSPTARRWWRDAAGLLSSGKLMTIDYGLTFEERFMPGRAGGTLRAYYRHRASANVLDRPGEQDITAHIDLTALQQAGEQCGLSTEFVGSQAEFLVSIGKGAWEGTAFSSWGPEQKRQFQTLTHPEHLGRAFRVLVQATSPVAPLF